MKKKAEILAPAGSIESMKAAILAGADAVYMGGSRFGARAYAENAQEEQLLEAIDYVHFHDKKLYLTVNTLLKEKELNGQLYDYMDRYYQHGLDAAIVQDFGVFSFLRKEFPNLPLHISTQMTITGPYGAGFMEGQGASRVVLARELSLKEIEEIRKNVNLELEVFVHGAICYCYSGQCLFSSILGGRSGNRGRCAQPCRLPYEVTAGGKRISGLNEPYVMNLKDMCALELLPKLLKAGVNSLKMEGRMKSPTYTAGVTELYRKYTDLYYEKGEHGYRVEPEDLKTVSKLFDRGGYTKRYFFEHNGMDMIAPGKKPKIRETDSELLKRIMERQKERERTDIRPVWGKVVLKQTAPVRLCFTDVKSGVFSETEGPVCQEAKSRPLTEEAVLRQLTKTGGTGFHLEKLEIETDGNVFLPVQSLNELRRDGISSLKEAFFAPYRREMDIRGEMLEEEKKEAAFGPYKPSLAVSMEELLYLKTALSVPQVETIEIETVSFPEAEWESVSDACRKAGKELYLAMPRIFRSEGRKLLEKNIDLLKRGIFDGFLIRNLEELSWLMKKEIPGRRVADDGLYTWNRQARDFLKPFFCRDTAPLELKEGELSERGLEGSEIMVYGRIPLMLTANCLKKTEGVCNYKTEWISIKDRKQVTFPVKTNCRFCYNTIYNSLPLCLFDQMDRLLCLKPSVLRLHFTTESLEEAEALLRQSVRCLENGQKEVMEAGTFTRGHFKRGVE